MLESNKLLELLKDWIYEKNIHWMWKELLYDGFGNILCVLKMKEEIWIEVDSEIQVIKNQIEFILSNSIWFQEYIQNKIVLKIHTNLSIELINEFCKK